MLKRLLVGLILGLLIGGLVGFGVAQVLPTAMAGLLGYALAAATGVLVGLVAGKPIWAKGAAIEAGLKAVVGALLGAGILFGLRFLSVQVPAIADFPAAPIGEHPIAPLVAVATLLAIFYELDNTGGDEEEQPKKRIAAGPTGKRIAGADADELEAEQLAAKKRKPRA